MTGTIRVGIGGWTFEPWRGTFYPADLPQKRELEYASRKVTAIEINGTYYSSQKPESFAKWRAESPEGFVFALKGTRFTTNRRILAEAGESIDGTARVVYVSPLKALAVDIAENLQRPLREIAAIAEELGFDAADIQVGVRTGDTPSAEHEGTTYFFCCPGCRGRFARNPEKYLASA